MVKKITYVSIKNVFPLKMALNDAEDIFPEVGDIINTKYQVTRRIGAGSFGAIFEVQNIEDGKIYAVKLEKFNTPSPQLAYEHKLYTILDAAVAFPAVYDFWQDVKYRGMVMERLGLSLGYYARKCGKILSMKTVLMCTIQMLCRLEYLHQRSFIHRDIKPDNFVFGVGNKANLLYMIDLGLAKKYRDLRTHQHENYSEDRGLAGTARYVSINVHQGVEQSCRDDLESVGYVIISLLKGRLPWQGMEACSKGEKYELMSQAKADTPLEVLCEGLPEEFLVYMNRVRNLRFDEKPPYQLFRTLFVNLMVKMNYCYDYKFDWTVSRAQRLDGALRGRTDPKRVIIPINPAEIENETKPDVKKSNFMQPLPFFSVIHEAAKFIGMSKKSIRNESDQENESNELPRQQTMFMLDPRHTQVPVTPMQTEFTPEN
ncbi:CK1 family protein kinase [Tritrichomonas foetus]|uniref:non-specific serine/threonine protein kinase n=1 Tax=Tritrichomonas foetus TaxID=1144522 RepID=A0A1J4J9B0_9EUKA|nr:CK1 family protein kinase [Tritrichomonas foetus]|eukprot:OHS94005.1 CK1 family protein kinase [Tritrichomonas foetus]